MSESAVPTNSMAAGGGEGIEKFDPVLFTTSRLKPHAPKKLKDIIGVIPSVKKPTTSNNNKD